MAATYAYKVRDKGGKVTQGTLEADSPTLVASKLRSMGLTPISIDKHQASVASKELHVPGFGPKVKMKQLSVFARQFATMINAGLTLLRTLSILENQTENKVLVKIIAEVRADVEKGASLSQALAKHPKVFNKLFVAMVRAGETAGVLDRTLLQLAAIIEKQVELRAKIKSAMTYPIAVLGLVGLILTAMLVFVVPMFAGMYKDLGGTLPLPTRILMVASSIFVKGFPVIVLTDVGAVWAFKRWVQTENGRGMWDRIKLRIPIFGKLTHKTAITRFARTFSVLLRSGVPILEALEITSETVGNSVAQKAIKDVQSGVRKGESLAKPLASHPIFPSMVVQMMAVGEETGALDEMLEKIAEFYEQEVQAMVDALTSLLEPLLIVVLGGAVGSMVVALYLPMFRVINLVK